MGDIKVGDRLPSPTGGSTEVIAVHPQGVKQLWRFVFSDGSKVACCDDHVWYGHWTLEMGKVADGDYKRGDERRRLFTTKNIRDKFERRKGNSFVIPLGLPANLHAPTTCRDSFDWYTLGVLLGDGSLTTEVVRFTSFDQEIVDRVTSAYPATKRSSVNKDGAFYIPMSDHPDVRKKLETWGLMGKNSQTKFIPALCQRLPIESRWALLQGLMDTDGYASERDAVYTTISPDLALGILELARGLGMKATLSDAKQKYAVWPDGSRHPGELSWDVRIQGLNIDQCFSLTRKKEMCKKQYDEWQWLSGKRLVAIEDAGMAEAQCITVSKLDGLFYTNDYIVTHNSDISRAFLIKGNPDSPWYDRSGRPLMVNMSYIHDPRYTALILRKNQDDLKDYIEHARELYEGMGARLLRQPFTFKWPSGAIFYTGHLADKNSWMKYLGQELHRIVIEEIVTIEDLSDYEAIVSCNRSAVRNIRPQIMATMNPKGPGLGWLSAYFRHEPEVARGSKNVAQVWDYEKGVWRMPAGKPVPERQQMKLRIWDEEDEKYLVRTRIWYHGKLSDNPAQNTPEYRAALRNISTPGMREAYAHGSWEATTGAYYTMFRPKGPVGDEPAEAKHVLPVSELPVLMPWEPRAIGADWGYGHDAAAVRLSRREDGRLVIEQCHSEPAFSTFQFGRIIGEMARQDLAECDDPVIVHLSPDCWSKESEVETEAKRISAGIADVVGPDRIWMGGESDTDRVMLERPGMVRVVRAHNSRVAGWTYMADLMVWNDALMLEGMDLQAYTQEEAQRIRALKGEREYERYMAAWQRSLPEVRPKFIIADRVENQKLIKAITRAQHGPDGNDDIDKKHFDGMDVLDACRYGVMGLKSYVAPENAGTERRRHFGELVKWAKATGDPRAKEAVWAYQQWMKEEAKKEEGATGLISLGLGASRQLKRLR